MAKAPWASGPGEILQHGLSLLREDSDVNRRLAMISIDNSVELMMKTYLGLPRRVTGLSISRKEYADFSESFTALLDALEKHAGGKLLGIDLGEIEWYHRLRNQLYHQGNGLTVERDKVTVYAELAKLLYTNLFACELLAEEPSSAETPGRFLASWVEMEKAVRALWLPLNVPDQESMRFHFIGNVEDLAKKGVLDSETAKEITELRTIRNKVVHGGQEVIHELDPRMIDRVKELTKTLQRKMKRPPTK
jgi:hypothetical protein